MFLYFNYEQFSLVAFTMSWTVSNPKTSAEIAQILISFKQIPSATDQGFQQRLAEQTNKTVPLYFSSYEPDCPQSSFKTSKPALFKQTRKERGHQSKGKPPLTTSKKSMTAAQTKQYNLQKWGQLPLFFTQHLSLLQDQSSQNGCGFLLQKTLPQPEAGLVPKYKYTEICSLKK